jgi:hypothetical protein
MLGDVQRCSLRSQSLSAGAAGTSAPGHLSGDGLTGCVRTALLQKMTPARMVGLRRPPF